MKKYGEAIQAAYKYSDSFQDYKLQLDEIAGSVRPFALSEKQDKQLQRHYNYPRNGNATGRLIYRMHSAGLLKDYVIDYQRGGISICTPRKYDSIKDYHKHIERYLRRYLSETVVLQKRTELRAHTNVRQLGDQLNELNELKQSLKDARKIPDQWDAKFQEVAATTREYTAAINALATSYLKGSNTIIGNNIADFSAANAKLNGQIQELRAIAVVMFVPGVTVVNPL